jgi:D-xylose transport system substrate-binding protein
MKNWRTYGLGLLALASLGTLAVSQAQKGALIGVSWSNFQEERWRTDESAITLSLSQQGAGYISTDAQASAEKQLKDVDELIAKGAKALVILALDKDAIAPAIAKAKAAKIPVIAYDRLIEEQGVFYLTFDNVEVGRIIAREVQKVKPKGNYVFLKGDPLDPNAEFLYTGQREVLSAAIKKGDIKVVGIKGTDGWSADNAQKNMVQILKDNANKVDAVLSGNDGIAGGAFAALSAVGLGGRVAIGGQDGDLAALNRVAQGNQTVSVWKDARQLGKRAAEIAVQLAKGTSFANIPGRAIFSKGPKKVPMNSVFLKPSGITKANLNIVLDAKWITKDALCEGVSKQTGPAVCK